MAMPEEKALEDKVETTEQAQPETKSDLFGPDNLDELTPEQLKEVRSQWNKNYTQKRQQEALEAKQTQDRLAELERNNVILENNLNQWNQVANDPSFMEWANNKMKGSQITEPEPTIDFEQYEGGEALKKMIDIMDSRINRAIKENLAPVMQNFATTREQNEWNTLVDFAKQTKTVDPNSIKKEIDFVRRSNPALSIRESYEIAAYRTTLNTRPPIVNIDENIKKEIPTTGGQRITLKPGASSYQASRKSPDDIMDEIIEDNKKSGSSKPVSIGNILRGVLREKGIDEREF
jgi:hypothetical protein